jgi:hypothetical protein
LIKILWFIHRPEQDIEGFERWYQDQHVPIGMRQELLQRFRISRSFYPQPAFVVRETGSAEPRAYRFSEGYWRSLDDVRTCYSSPNGRAALADGPLNIGPLVGPAPRPTVLLQEEVLPVDRELDFDIREGGYRAPLACKLFGILRLKPGAAERFDAAVRDLAQAAGGHPDLRGQVLGRALDETVQLGRFAQIPPVGGERFDRTVEYYFESPQALDRFCAGETMGQVAALAKAEGEAVVWDAAQIQEVFFTSLGRQPLEAAWIDFYRA